LLIFAFLQAKPYTINHIQCIKVYDGDTATFLTTQKQKLKVRLYGIDAPEKKQAFGETSTKVLREIILSNYCNLKIYSKDRYGRSVGEIFYKKHNINIEMVRGGYAYWYKKYSPKRKDYQSAQEEAKERKKGVWSNPNAIKPSEYRKQKKARS
jgi:endonuclease YncB( thermonuclease family)